jgi:hypothetical protein
VAGFEPTGDSLTIEGVLLHYGVIESMHRTGNHLSGPCPIHGGTNPTQFRVTLEKNIWNCFGDCKAGGNALDFIARKEGVPIYNAALLACKWFNIPVPMHANTGSGRKHGQPIPGSAEKESWASSNSRTTVAGTVNPPVAPSPDPRARVK